LLLQLDVKNKNHFLAAVTRSVNMLKLVVFIAFIAVAAGAACPIDKFMGNWTGTCSQTPMMRAACASVEACAAVGLAGLAIGQGYDGSTTNPPCTQVYNFAFYKVGSAIMYDWSVGALTAPCKNAVSPNANLFAFFTRGDPLQYSFSVNDNGNVQSFFGASAPCFLATGATPPTGSTANTFLASVNCGSTSGCQYREYGSYDITYNYVSPNNPNNPNMYTSVLPSASDWTTLGPMYSNAALTARPAGSVPLDASRGLYSTGGANLPIYTYTCSAKKLETISSGSASVASMWLLLAAAFAVAAVY